MTNMKFSIISSLLPFVALLFATSSCSLDQDDPATKTMYSYTQCFNAITDLGVNTVQCFESPNYGLTLISDGTASLLISNLILEKDAAPISIRLQNLKWGVDANKAWTLITGPEETADGHTISNFNMMLLARLDKIGGPVYSISYRVDGRYYVCVLPLQTSYFGNTATVAEGQNTPFMSYPTEWNPNYSISLDPKTMTATIDIIGISFASAMPGMNITISDVPFMPNTAAGYRIATGQGQSFIPTIKDVPYPSFPISNIAMESTMYSGANLSFDCTAGKLGNYNVKTTLQYLFTPVQ